MLSLHRPLLWCRRAERTETTPRTDRQELEPAYQKKRLWRQIAFECPVSRLESLCKPVRAPLRSCLRATTPPEARKRARGLEPFRGGTRQSAMGALRPCIRLEARPTRRL